MTFRTRLLTLTSLALLMSRAAIAQQSFEEGLEARYAGELNTAVAIFSGLTEENPQNSDAWVQLGLTQLALQNYSEAESALKSAIAISPDYSDAYLGLARLEWYRGDAEAAETYLNRAGETEDARALRRQMAEAPAPQTSRNWRADAAIGYNRLSNDLPAWTEAQLGLTYSLDATSAIGGDIQYARRFETTDIFAALRYAKTFQNGSSWFVMAGGATDADFRPEMQVMSGGELPLAAAENSQVELWGNLSGTLARYASGNVESANVGLQLRIDEDRYRLGTNLLWLSDETGTSRTGTILNAEWQVIDQLRLLASFAEAPETSDGRTLDVTSTSLGARFSVGDIGFQVSAMVDDRQFYDSRGVILSVNRRF